MFGSLHFRYRCCFQLILRSKELERRRGFLDIEELSAFGKESEKENEF